jgi:hypothetical protein
VFDTSIASDGTNYNEKMNSISNIPACVAQSGRPACSQSPAEMTQMGREKGTPNNEMVIENNYNIH